MSKVYIPEEITHSSFLTTLRQGSTAPEKAKVRSVPVPAELAAHEEALGAAVAAKSYTIRSCRLHAGSNCLLRYNMPILSYCPGLNDKVAIPIPWEAGLIIEGAITPYRDSTTGMIPSDCQIDRTSSGEVRSVNVHRSTRDNITTDCKTRSKWRDQFQDRAYHDTRNNNRYQSYRDRCWYGRTTK